MEIKETSISGLFEINPRVFGDHRGYFFESFNQKEFEKHVPGVSFVQDNESFSTKGVLRGLHFQKGEAAQGKLVRVVQGRVLDVAVDIRKESKTYGQHVAIELTAEKHNMIYVPPGFAHGFAVLEDAVFQYKCTNFYNKEAESGILWNDPELNIDWKVDAPTISDKDKELPLFKELS